MKEAKTFNITPKLKVKFENNKSVIYVDGRLFNHCKFLLLINPQEKERQRDIDSIDEAKKNLSTDLERRIKPEDLGITPEQEFWAHCSNLQAWEENNYDTRLLHSNLAFPLLKRLTEAGDHKAKRVFKEEITKRVLGNYLPIKEFLLEEHYLDYFTTEEIKSILEDYKENIIKINCRDNRIKELEVLVFIGLKYLDAQYHDDIVETYSNLSNSEIYMKTAVIWYEFYFICSRFYDKDLAKYCFQKVIEINNRIIREKKIKKNLHDWFELGVPSKKCKQYPIADIAIKYFKNVRNIDINYTNACAQIGTIYNDIYMHHKAIEAFKRALRIEPQNVDILFSLAYIYHDLGKETKVARICKKILRINSENIEAWDLLATAYREKGKIDKAINCSLRALKIEPNYPLISEKLTELYYMKNDYDSALYYGQRVLEIYPKDSIALDTLCKIYLKRGNFNEAIQICKNALKTEYPYSSEWLLLGKIYFKMKQYHIALKSFFKVLQYRHYDDEVWDYIEMVHHAQGDKDSFFNDIYSRLNYITFLKSIGEVS